jgi:hypothetical protein
MSEAANIPEHRIMKPRPTLRDMSVGETWLVWFTALKVIGGRCYLNPNEEKRSMMSGSTIRVHRNEAGYHVLVSDPAMEFLESGLPAEDLIPVATFTEEEPEKKR